MEPLELFLAKYNFEINGIEKIIQEGGGTKDFLKYKNKRILQKVN
mgnify:CR=1 FL=1